MKKHSAATDMARSLFDEVLGDCCCSSCGDSALGDIISTEGDCKEGEVNVEQLKTFYAKAGSPAKWKAAVDTILASYAEAEDSWSRHVPFSPVCGEIKAIGVQAQKLMADIAADTNTKAPAAVQAPTSSTETLLKIAPWAAGIAGLALAANLLGVFKAGR